jgi:hypothetical protein
MNKDLIIHLGAIQGKPYTWDTVMCRHSFQSPTEYLTLYRIMNVLLEMDTRNSTVYF